MTVENFSLAKVYIPEGFRIDKTKEAPQIPRFSEPTFKAFGGVVKREDKDLAVLIESTEQFKTNLLSVDEKEARLLKEKAIAPFNKGFSGIATGVLVAAAAATVVALALLIWPSTGPLGLLIVAPILLGIAICLGFSISKLIRAYKKAPSLEKSLEHAKQNSGVEDYAGDVQTYLKKNNASLKEAINTKIRAKKKELKNLNKPEEALAATNQITALRNARAELKYLNAFYSS